MRFLNEIVIHCTATPEGRDVSVADIRKWHKDRGWKDIGYHYVILLDGSIQIGRPIDQIGAHVEGRNRSSIGVVYVGGLDRNNKPKDTRTPAQKAALISLLNQLLSRYATISLISGHRDYANKACPSFDATKEYAYLTKAQSAPRPTKLISDDIDPADGAEKASIFTQLPILRPIGQVLTGIGITGTTLLSSDWKTVAVVGAVLVVGIGIWAVVDQIRKRRQ